jgi:hypothetical protein
VFLLGILAVKNLIKRLDALSLALTMTESSWSMPARAKLPLRGMNLGGWAKRKGVTLDDATNRLVRHTRWML